MLTSESRKHDFPSLEGRTYLNTAAEGIPPRCVRDALLAYGEDKLLGFDGRQRHQAQWDAARQWTGRFYGLSPEEISICSCSSEAYNLAFLALNAKPGDEVILNDLDFPAGATPWMRSGAPATVKIWRSRAGALRVEDLVPLLGPRTRLVQTSLVSYYNGFLIPLRTVVEAVRKHSSALISVDVTQALGRIPLDLTDVDLIVSSTHKWILASHGGGLVGAPRTRSKQWTVPAGGWFNFKDPFTADRFDREPVHSPGAASFMVGMPNYAAVYAARAALEHLDGVGVPAIHARAQPLVEDCLRELAKLPVQLITPHEPDALAGIIAFCRPDAERIRGILHAKGVHVMHAAGRIRISIHGYNTADDIQTFLRALKEAL